MKSIVRIAHWFLATIAWLGRSNDSVAEEKVGAESGVVRPVAAEVLAKLKEADNLPQSKDFMARRRAEIKAIIDLQREQGQAAARSIRAAGGQATFCLCDVAAEEEVRQSIHR
jgi:hypothetical protein